MKKAEKDIESIMKRVVKLTGIKESDTGLAHPGLWDLNADKQMLAEQPPLQVARCTKIIPGETEETNKCERGQTNKSNRQARRHRQR